MVFDWWNFSKGSDRSQLALDHRSWKRSQLQESTRWNVPGLDFESTWLLSQKLLWKARDANWRNVAGSALYSFAFSTNYRWAAINPTFWVGNLIYVWTSDLDPRSISTEASTAAYKQHLSTQVCIGNTTKASHNPSPGKINYLRFSKPCVLVNCR